MTQQDIARFYVPLLLKSNLAWVTGLFSDFGHAPSTQFEAPPAGFGDFTDSGKKQLAADIEYTITKLSSMSDAIVNSRVFQVLVRNIPGASIPAVLNYSTTSYLSRNNRLNDVRNSIFSLLRTVCSQVNSPADMANLAASSNAAIASIAAGHIQTTVNDIYDRMHKRLPDGVFTSILAPGATAEHENKYLNVVQTVLTKSSKAAKPPTQVKSKKGDPQSEYNISRPLDKLPPIESKRNQVYENMNAAIIYHDVRLYTLDSVVDLAEMMADENSMLEEWFDTKGGAEMLLERILQLVTDLVYATATTPGSVYSKATATSATPNQAAIYRLLKDWMADNFSGIEEYKSLFRGLIFLFSGRLLYNASRSDAMSATLNNWIPDMHADAIIGGLNYRIYNTELSNRVRSWFGDNADRIWPGFNSGDQKQLQAFEINRNKATAMFALGATKFLETLDTPKKTFLNKMRSQIEEELRMSGFSEDIIRRSIDIAQASYFSASSVATPDISIALGMTVAIADQFRELSLSQKVKDRNFIRDVMEPAHVGAVNAALFEMISTAATMALNSSVGRHARMFGLLFSGKNIIPNLMKKSTFSDVVAKPEDFGLGSGSKTHIGSRPLSFAMSDIRISAARALQSRRSGFVPFSNHDPGLTSLNASQRETLFTTISATNPYLVVTDEDDPTKHTFVGEGDLDVLRNAGILVGDPTRCNIPPVWTEKPSKKKKGA